MDGPMIDDEEDADEDEEKASSDIAAFCARCRGDTPHTVVSRYEDEIRRVRCNSCEDIHAFRRPRNPELDDSAEPLVRRKTLRAKPTWVKVLSKNPSEPRPYDGDEVYCDRDVITHPIFGIGFISELIGQDKVEITFQSDKRIFVHNRKLLPLQLVSSQRQAVAAQIKAGGKANAREAASATAREAALLSTLPKIDALAPSDGRTDVTMTNSTQRSSQAAAVLEKADADDPRAEDIDEDAGGTAGRANQPAPARVAASAEANGESARSARPLGKDLGAGGAVDRTRVPEQEFGGSTTSAGSWGDAVDDRRGHAVSKPNELDAKRGDDTSVGKPTPACFAHRGDPVGGTPTTPEPDANQEDARSAAQPCSNISAEVASGAPKETEAQAAEQRNSIGRPLVSRPLNKPTAGPEESGLASGTCLGSFPDELMKAEADNMARKPGRKTAAKTHDRTQAAGEAKSSGPNAMELRNLISRLRVEHQHHADSIAEIDQTFREYGIGGDSSPRKGPKGRRKATSAAPRPPKKGRGGRSKGTKAPKARQTGIRRFSSSRNYSVTGQDLILQVLKDKGGLSTEEIRKHWQGSGRGGKADNYLTGLVQSGQVKRTKLAGRAGSRYSLP